MPMKSRGRYVTVSQALKLRQSRMVTTSQSCGDRSTINECTDPKDAPLPGHDTQKQVLASVVRFVLTTHVTNALDFDDSEHVTKFVRGGINALPHFLPQILLGLTHFAANGPANRSPQAPPTLRPVRNHHKKTILTTAILTVNFKIDRSSASQSQRWRTTTPP